MWESDILVLVRITGLNKINKDEVDNIFIDDQTYLNWIWKSYNFSYFGNC